MSARHASTLVAAFGRARRGFVPHASAAFGIMITTIAVHSLFDNALFEDTVCWSFHALAAVARRTEEPEPA